MQKPMAGVIKQLVAQRKASCSMMMEMQPAMMTMECPMMKTGNAPEPKAEEKKPKK